MRKGLMLLSVLLVVLISAGCLDGIGFPMTGSFEGYVYDAVTSLPLSGAEVYLDSQTYITDDSGYFIFHNINTGQYSLTVNAAGYIGQTHQFTLEPDYNYMEIRLVKENGQNTLSGYTLDNNSVPVPDMNMSFYSYTDGNTYSAYSDSNGYYSITLPAGQYSICAEKWFGNGRYYTARDIDFTTTTNLNFYLWMGDFGLGVVDTKTPVAYWPEVNIGEAVYYEISIYKQWGGAQVLEQQYITQDCSVQLGYLTEHAGYHVEYKVYSQATEEKLTFAFSGIYVDTPILTPVDEVEAVVNDYANFSYQNSYEQLAALISDNYSDNFDRDKAALLSSIEQDMAAGKGFIIREISINPYYDPNTGEFIAASVDGMYVIGDMYYQTVTYHIHLELVKTNGVLQISLANYMQQ